MNVNLSFIPTLIYRSQRLACRRREMVNSIGRRSCLSDYRFGKMGRIPAPLCRVKDRFMTPVFAASASLIENARRQMRRIWSREVGWRCRQLSGMVFDLLFNVRTTKLAFLDRLEIVGGNVGEGRHYEATPWSLLSKIFRHLPLDLADYTFVDYGSGKGRQVLSASRWPFRGVVGVDFSPELCAMARQNVPRFRPPRRAGGIEIVCGDAIDFLLPAGPCLLLFFRPFSNNMMREVLSKIREFCLIEQRSVLILLCGFLSQELEEIYRWQLLSETKRMTLRCDLFFTIDVRLTQIAL